MENVIASRPLYILWFFAIERFNGLLKAKTHSQSQVNQNLSINILQTEQLNHLLFILDYAAINKQPDTITDGHYQFAMHCGTYDLHHDLECLVAFCTYLAQLQTQNTNIIYTFTNILEQVTEEAHDWQIWAQLRLPQGQAIGCQVFREDFGHSRVAI